MDVNDKVKELEDELKLLKAEIQNTLLDIREVVLERKNPLGEDGQSAHLTMDLNTTARTMATEAAAGEARKAAEAGDATLDGAEPDPDADVDPETEAVLDAEGEPADVDESPSPEVTTEGSAPEQLSEDGSDSAPVFGGGDAPAGVESDPAADREVGTPVAATEVDMPDNAEIPDMFMADLAPLSGDGSLADWVTSAIDSVGVEDLRRVVAMFRLWGNVPPNISRALAHLQELLASSDEPRPPWLQVLQDLDRLASL
ncbi:MAG: hypothetical protein ACE5FA_06225 [Dehalococcoidia bacterium]